MKTLKESLKKSFLKGMFDVDDIAERGMEEEKIKNKYDADLVNITDDTIIIAKQRYTALLTDVLRHGNFKNIYVQELCIDCDVPSFVKKIGSSYVTSSKEIKMSDVDFVSLIPGYENSQESDYNFGKYNATFNNVTFQRATGLWFTDQTVFKNCTVTSGPYSSIMMIQFSCGPEEVKQKLSELYDTDLMTPGRYAIKDVTRRALEHYGLKMDKIRVQDSVSFHSKLQKDVIDDIVACSSRKNYLVVNV